MRLVNNSELETEFTKGINHVFNLNTELPIRICIYEITKTAGSSVSTYNLDELMGNLNANNIMLSEFYISIVIHHIAFDGWSTDIFLKEFYKFYKYYKSILQIKSAKLDLPSLEIQYKDFALWQRDYLSGETLAKQLAYWKDKLIGYETLNLITDKPRPIEIGFSGNDIHFVIEKHISQQLKQLAKNLGVSLYSVLLAGYYLMLSRMSGQDDVVIGTPVANRHYPQIENLIGFFINTLALRVKINSKEQISQFIERVGSEVIEAQLHQDLPFEKLVDTLKVEKDTSRHPIFQVMFEVQNFGNDFFDPNLNSLLLPYRSEYNLYKVAKFDISTTISYNQDELEGTFNYSTELFNKETIERFIKVYTEVLKQFTSLVDINKDVNNLYLTNTVKISELKYFSVHDYQKTIYLWNATESEYPRKGTIQELFEEQVEKTPDAVALIYEEICLSYRELNNRANRLTNYLREHYSIKADDLICLCLERSEHMLIAILAVLKAGGAYVPIDPSYPKERIEYILKDTATKVVITNEIYQDTFREIPGVVLIDNTFFQAQLLQQSEENYKTVTTSRHLAYVIYTSGTTGNPKGVMIEHQGVVNLKYCLTKQYALGQPDNQEVIVGFANYVFDTSVEQIILSLLNGYILLLIPDKLWLDKDIFCSYLNKNNATHLEASPTFIQQYDFSKILTLKRLVCGGEALTKECLLKINLSNRVEIINSYGPSEVSITSIVNINQENHLPIGKPISNTQVYVLNTDLIPIPVGAVGELYIGGIGLARGYLNRPELTAERFIANPFQTETERRLDKNARLYKTGDLARWLSDGNLEYIGRNDFQVKIRGYRIELGEIENVLCSYAGIKQAVALAKGHTEEKNDTNAKFLVGYYVSDKKLEDEPILNHLRVRLPDYMVPSVLFHLEKLPLTLNGKLDRKALPEPNFIESDNYVAPRNELEKQLCQIWCEVLGLPENAIGIRADFFKLGGDSIVSIQLVSRFRQRLALNVNVKDIFTYKTIERLYDNILSKRLEHGVPVEIKTEQGLLIGEVALLPIQRWFFESHFKKASHWNQAFTIKVPCLEIERLRASVSKLVLYHDAFRLKYRKDKEGNYRQYYDLEAKCEELKILDIKEIGVNELSELLTEWQSGFDLEGGPLYSIGYIQGYVDGSARIHFAVHHLLIDTVSWRILVEDLRNIYNQKELGNKGSSYRQWAEAVKRYGESHESERMYWDTVLQGHQNETVNKLIFDSDKSNYTKLTLSEERTRQLLQESHRAYHTQVNDILLTALGYALSELTNNKVNYIVLEGHGREEIEEGIEVTRTMGWFTTVYPVQLEMKEDLGKSLKNIKETIRQIPCKGLGYGALLGYVDQQLPRVSFNYLGQFDQNEGNSENSWQIVRGDSGKSSDDSNDNHNILDINGSIIGGRLQFSILSKLDADTTHKIADIFKKKLEMVIEYTASLERSYLTASDIHSIISQDYLDRIQANREVEGIYLANSLQQGFIYHSLYQGDVDDAYIVQSIWHYNSRIAVDKLVEAWRYAQRKYQALRLRFFWEEELVQVIDKMGDVEWQFIDLSSQDDIAEQETEIHTLQEADQKRRYYLDQGNLFRLYFIKQKEDLYTCIFSSHHAILDGWSGPILLDYVHDTYLKLVDNQTIKGTIDPSYEYAQKYLQDNRSKNKNYWDTYISGIETRNNPLAPLINLYEESEITLNNYKHVKNINFQILDIKDDLYNSLKNLSQKEGITLNSISQYTWHKILNIYSNSNQTIVGITIAGRNLPIDNIENSVGLYINTLPLIVNHNNKIMETIREVQNNINEFNDRGEICLAELQTEGKRLFDSLFIYENYPNIADGKHQEKLKIQFKNGREKTDYPLVIIAYENNGKLKIKISYSSDLFRKEIIFDLLSLFKNILQQISINPYQSWKNINILNKQQFKRVINSWNVTDRDYPYGDTLAELFEKQVKESPNRIAFVCEGTKLTFKELNVRANQLAHYLNRNHTILPDDLICLHLKRNEHMIIAILAVLKAGGAYVPIEPNYPEERIEYILKDTATKVVITNEGYQDIFREISGVVLIDNTSFQARLLEQSEENLKTLATSRHLAYVIYTSGTTGSPKGVMIEQRSVINLAQSSKKMLIKNTPDTGLICLWYSSYVFDAHVWEIFGNILNGNTIHLIEENLRKDLNLLKSYIFDNKINVALLPPALLNTENHLNLDVLILGGEKSYRKLLDHYAKNNVKIINAYGPTEATVYVSLNEYEKNGSANIGAPIENAKVYALNTYLMPVPIGAIGELYIGGEGLARGYLNKFELTAERFIANPFQTEEERRLGRNVRLYKTGDLVRWLADGNLEYIGRNDFQVKINGYRIELGEIESILCTYEGIKHSVVLVKEWVGTDQLGTSSKSLIGYYISDNKLDEENIIQYLRRKLPNHMVPNILIHLRHLPLTVNGKLDKKALLDVAVSMGDNYLAPRNELEEKMSKLWSELLGLPQDKIGVLDDFFTLGGDSIKAVRLASKISKELKVHTSIATIFACRTIDSLLEHHKAQMDTLSTNIVYEEWVI